MSIITILYITHMSHLSSTLPVMYLSFDNSIYCIYLLYLSMYLFIELSTAQSSKTLFTVEVLTELSKKHNKRAINAIYSTYTGEKMILALLNGIKRCNVTIGVKQMMMIVWWYSRSLFLFYDDIHIFFTIYIIICIYIIIIYI